MQPSSPVQGPVYPARTAHYDSCPWNCGRNWVVEGGTLFIDEQGGTRDWTIAYGPGHWKTARVIVDPQEDRDVPVTT